MTMKTYANYPQGQGQVQYVALPKLLFRAGAFERIGFACEEQTLQAGTGASVNLRRWINPAVNTTGETEGVTPVSRALVPEDFFGTMTRYSEVFEVSRYEYDLSPYDSVMGATDVLGDLIKETRERVRWNAAISGTSVAYNSSANTARNQVNGTITLGRLQIAIRAIEAAKGRTFTPESKGSTNFGSSPVEAGYICYYNTDLNADIRAIPGFRSRSELGGGQWPEGTFGAVQNIVFVPNPEYPPLYGAGAAGTSFKNTAGVIDVYQMVICARGALTAIKLAGKGRGGFGNAKIKVLDEEDKSDPTNARVYISAAWYDLALVTSQEWLYRLEVAVTLNPA